MIGDDIRIRRIEPGDARALERFYAELSAESRTSRFHAALRGIGHDQAEKFAAADHRSRDGFVAESAGRIVGHLVLEPMSDGAEELAVAVDDRVQHRGVGTLLLAAAIASARLRGVKRLVAWVRPENGAMRRLLVSSRRPLHLSWEGPIARYDLSVPPTALRRAAA